MNNVHCFKFIPSVHVDCFHLKFRDYNFFPGIQVSPHDDQQSEASSPESRGDNAGCRQCSAQDEHTGEQTQGQKLRFSLVLKV